MPPYPEQRQTPPGHTAEMRPRPDHGEESYTGHGQLTGKTALITGGDSGIGRAVAIAFAREGADVVISYLNEEEDARESARWVQDAERKAVLAGGDIGDEPFCRDLVDLCYQECGRFDILVNNAAFQSTHQEIGEWSAEELERTFRTNVFAPFYLCKAALPRMARGAAIINTTSIQAFKPSESLLAYSATKGALVTFTKALSSMAIERGVRVNAVAPGPIWTPLIPSTMSPEHVEQFGSTTPMGRAGQPAELAPVYVFLASEQSSYITGEVIGVTGGKPL